MQEFAWLGIQSQAERTKKTGNSKFIRGMSFLIKIICTKMNAMDDENAISSWALEWHIIKRNWVDLCVFFVLHALSQWGQFRNWNCVRASTDKCHWAFHVETRPNLHCFNYTSLSPSYNYAFSMKSDFSYVKTSSLRIELNCKLRIMIWIAQWED